MLIADDDPDDRQALIEELSAQRPEITVRHVARGRELLDFLGNCPADELPTVLVLDYNMPDLNGPQILRELASDDRYAPIVKVMWSSSQRSKDIQECCHLGAVQYLIKPGSIGELKDVTRHLTHIFEAAAF